MICLCLHNSPPPSQGGHCAAEFSPPVPGRKETLPPPLAAAPFDSRQAKAHQRAWANYLRVETWKASVIR